MEITRVRPRVAVIVNKRREAEGFLDGLKESGFLSYMEFKEEEKPKAPWYRMAYLRVKASLECMDLALGCYS